MEEHNAKPQAAQQAEDEIDLIAIAKTLWTGRKTILIATGIAAVLGVLVALLTPKEFTVKTVLVPQMSGGKSSQLSGLASLAGVDLGMAETSELSPVIYPQVVNSVPFKLELMHTPLHFSKVDSAVSLFEYYTIIKRPSLLGVVKKYTLGLPGLLLSAIRPKHEELVLLQEMGPRPKQLSKNEYAIKKNLDSKVSLIVDKKEGYLSLHVNMSEPYAAAEMAQKALDLLQQYIISFKVEKSQAELDFIQERYDNAKKEAEFYQVEFAKYSDQYKDLTSRVPQVEVQKIQTRMTIANSVYQQLASQLEQAKIQVKKDTPVFIVVEPVVVPTIHSKPNISLTLFIALFLGVTIGIAIVYLYKYFLFFKKKWCDL